MPPGQPIAWAVRGSFTTILDRLGFSLALSTRPNHIIFLGSLDGEFTATATLVTQPYRARRWRVGALPLPRPEPSPFSPTHAARRALSGPALTIMTPFSYRARFTSPANVRCMT